LISRQRAIAASLALSHWLGNAVRLLHKKHPCSTPMLASLSVGFCALSIAAQHSLLNLFWSDRLKLPAAHNTRFDLDGLYPPAGLARLMQLLFVAIGASTAVSTGRSHPIASALFAGHRHTSV